MEAERRIRRKPVEHENHENGKEKTGPLLPRFSYATI